jgi:anti-sigma factor ChrR (cupin superfamily)
MNHDHPLGDSAELAALYVAGALPPAEHQAFVDHLEAGCPPCIAAVRELDSVLIGLSSLVEPVPPDPRSRARLLQAIAPSPAPPADAAPVPSGGAAGEWFFQRASEGVWQPTPYAGVSVRMLFADQARKQYTALVRMAPGSTYPGHPHPGPEECLVLEGDLRAGGLVLHAWDYQRAPAGSVHETLSTEQGCLLLVTAPLEEDLGGPHP